MVRMTDESTRDFYIDGSGVYIRFPLPDERLFRNKATEDILKLFLKNLDSEFTVTELREITGHGGDTVQTAIEVLEAADLIQTRTEGRKKLISANTARFNAQYGTLAVPQEEFRKPVRGFLKGTENLDIDIVGIILFGSVARGEADRASDIDIQVIVDHKLTEARRELHEVRQVIENKTYDGERYEIQLLVESVESAKNHGKKLQEIFMEGIELYATEKLDEVKEVVFHGEQ
jgi:predicted nucleotidyltransferase